MGTNTRFTALGMCLLSHFSTKDWTNTTRMMGMTLEPYDASVNGMAPKKLTGSPAETKRAPGGMQHHGCHRRGENRVAFKLLCLGERKHDRQEVEDAIGEDVQHLIRLRGGVDQVEHYEQSHNRFDHTGTGKRGDDGLERACDEVDHRVEWLFLLLRCRCRLCAIRVDEFLDLLEHVGNMGSDDDLELPAAMDDAHGPIERVDGVLVRCAFICNG